MKNMKENRKKSARKSTQRTNNRPWDELKDEEKLDALTTALTAAGSEEEFREQCTDPDPVKVRKAVGDRAGVVFGSDMTVRFIPDEDTALKEVLLLMPDFVPPLPGGNPLPVDAKKNWLCTYITYRESGTRRRLNTKKKSSR